MMQGELMAVVGALCASFLVLAVGYAAAQRMQAPRRRLGPGYSPADEWVLARVGDFVDWRAVDDDLPDCDESVLLAFSDAGDLMVIQGYRDDSEQEETGTQWRDVTAWPVRGVTHWAPLPDHPLGPVTAARQA